MDREELMVAYMRDLEEVRELRAARGTDGCSRCGSFAHPFEECPEPGEEYRLQTVEAKIQIHDGSEIEIDPRVVEAVGWADDAIQENAHNDPDDGLLRGAIERLARHTYLMAYMAGYMARHVEEKERSERS